MNFHTVNVSEGSKDPLGFFLIFVQQRQKPQVKQYVGAFIFLLLRTKFSRVSSVQTVITGWPEPK